MAEPSICRPHNVIREDRSNGTIYLRSGYDLPEAVDTSGDWLKHWAAKRPDTVFLAERDGPGWREVTYAESWEKVRAIASALLDLGMGPDTPILIISGNGIDHGLLTLAAHYVGIPTVPVAEQYSLIPGAQTQLQFIARLIRPRMVYANDAERFAASLGMEELAGLHIVVSHNANAGMMSIDDLLKGGSSDVEAAAARVGPDSVVKILMTSGSTSYPKGVLTTHRMMCVNQMQNASVMPFLERCPPRLVDWLPWNHVFGGSYNFNLVLANGGSLYIDAGKPAKGLIQTSIENNSLKNGTIAFNVPVGFTLLRDEMRNNDALRRSYFADLDMLFYAGASLPRDVWQDLSDMAMEVRGEPLLMATAWGLTETAPSCLMQHEPAATSGIVGVPLPGVEVKLVPEQDGRFDVRVRGPNIMPGYFNDPEKTAEVFDEDGFFKSGDAMSLVDPSDMTKGLRFEGRLSEDFKLSTGIWVRAAALRLDVLVTLAPLAADVIVTGDGHDQVGVLIVPAPDLVAGGTLDRDGAALVGAGTQEEIGRRLVKLSKTAKGRSNRVTRAMILAEPPSMADGEITAKGNLNFRKLLARRGDAVERLYSDTDPAVIHV